jgi:hypothetical protein
MTRNDRPGDATTSLRVLGSGADPAAAFAPEALIDEAARATGLAAALTADERAALEAVCGAFAREAPQLTLLGRTRAAHVLRESLAKLFCVRSYAERIPGLPDALPSRPIFIVAPFRTGTTFLHRLLAQDPELRWMRTWEGAHAPPAEPELRLDPRYFQLDRRVALVEGQLERLHRINPRLREAHDTGARLPEECFGLLETAFTSHSFMFYGRVPDYLGWLDRLSESRWLASYRRYALQLALLQWWLPATRWVLKSPVHLWNLDALLTVFPDALVVLLHRDPRHCVPSFCRLLAAHYTFAYRRMDDATVGADACDYMRRVLERAASARRRWPAERFVDLGYEDLVANPLASVRRLYTRAGATLAAEAESRMRAWLLRQPRPASDRPYSVAQYGLDPATLVRDFADWTAART